MDQHVYNREEAQAILDAFPEETVQELVKIATLAKQRVFSSEDGQEVILPDGWAYEVFGNCVIAAYLDGEQLRRDFFVPVIRIDYEFVDSIVTKREVWKKYALGTCSCGKPMPFVKLVLMIDGMMSRRGYLRFPSMAVGLAGFFFLFVWARFDPMQAVSLEYNRHPECL